MPDRVLSEIQRDALQEIANMGMGEAATRLSGFLNSFIELSVPRVRVVTAADAGRTLTEMTGIAGTVTAVRQGFRSEIKGEALVICRSAALAELGALLPATYGGYPVHEGEADEPDADELVFDVANLITGACVSSILEWLGRQPVFSPPDLLANAVTLDDVFRTEMLVWDLALLVEVSFSLEFQRFRAHLVMLMDEDSIGHVSHALDELVDSL
ncbi:MAG TPA: chemotaxis protein CheC [Paraburkholderia sp.]|nr:chemotaxis protein CheC [Paraburkholderia sp.]